MSVVTQNYKLLGRNCPFLIFNTTFFPNNSDLKSQKTEDGTPSYAATVIGEWSLLNGTLWRYDDYGNISYGIFGKAANFPDNDLYKGSNLNQMWKDIFGGTSGNGDEQRDVLMIMTGIENYKYFQK
ncbi:polymorphic toxin type 44 domain-containing protein [Chitinophaga costaii]|uniref:polymorphic toxin type 44 domain-containing protein n=1 Tax=Chitinophaga costaii TaxID=1335309 RepID=UPI0013FD3E60|nr:polymorphic toxin type 44 domain-containing protein [Chitinophaga costaii]